MASNATSTADILAQIPAARRREARARNAGLRATGVHYDAATRRIVLTLSNGYLLGVPVRAVPSLARATAAQLATVHVSPSGGMLTWDALDVDLSVPGLVLSALPRAEQGRELARIAGQAKSPAKARSARANGAKGGRPRKKSELSTNQA